MNRLARCISVVLFAIAWIATSRALPADARISDHGKTVFFQTVYIKPDETVDGDLNVVFGDAQIAGTVRGDVNTIFGKCQKLEGAVIDGEEHCLPSDGALAVVPWMAPSTTFGQFAEQDRSMIVKLASSSIVLLVFLLFPTRMRLALDRVERHPGLSAMIGVVALVAVIPVAFLLLLSIIGIPLIALEVAAIFVGVWIGTGAVSLLVGRRLCELVMPRTTPSPLLALLLGLVVVSAAEIVPVVGWAVTALVWLVGLGATILAFAGSSLLGRATCSPIGGPPMRQSS